MSDPPRVVRRAPLELPQSDGESREALPAVRLASAGQIYVTLRAAERYAAFEGLRPEEARKELTDRLLDARLVRDEPPKAQWRYRSRQTDLDITATTIREGRLLVVVGITTRDRGPSHRGGPTR